MTLAEKKYLLMILKEARGCLLSHTPEGSERAYAILCELTCLIEEVYEYEKSKSS